MMLYPKYRLSADTLKAMTKSNCNETLKRQWYEFLASEMGEIPPWEFSAHKAFDLLSIDNWKPPHFGEVGGVE